MFGTSTGIFRKTIDTDPRCFMMFTRKRATPGMLYAQS